MDIKTSHIFVPNPGLLGWVSVFQSNWKGGSWLVSWWRSEFPEIEIGHKPEGCRMTDNILKSSRRPKGHGPEAWRVRAMWRPFPISYDDDVCPESALDLPEVFQRSFWEVCHFLRYFMQISGAKECEDILISSYPPRHRSDVWRVEFLKAWGWREGCNLSNESFTVREILNITFQNWMDVREPQMNVKWVF